MGYAGKRHRTKVARMQAHREVMDEFIRWLDVYWPLWRQHEGEPRWHDLKKAFEAGWKAA